MEVNAKCVVLVPTNGHIEPACEDGLRSLEKIGYVVKRIRGYAAIDQARNELASSAIDEGFEETMWIDSDIGFTAVDVEKLRSHNLPITCGVYAKKGVRAIAIHTLPGAESLQFGQSGGLTEIRYAAAGFMHVRRDTYLAIKEKLSLPTCNLRFGSGVTPYFQPMIINDPKRDRQSKQDDYWYLAEDYAFCERARQAGLSILADTSIRLYHFGSYGYSWEDAGADQPRFENYQFRLT